MLHRKREPTASTCFIQDLLVKTVSHASSGLSWNQSLSQSSSYVDWLLCFQHNQVVLINIIDQSSSLVVRFCVETFAIKSHKFCHCTFKVNSLINFFI